MRRGTPGHRQGLPLPRRACASAGFTLLEMLVALAIFSLAALALVRLQGVSARTSVDLNSRTMAQIVARNLMIERMTDPQPPALGASNGVAENGGRKWPWIQRVDKGEDGRLLIVTVRVDAGPGQSPAVLTFGRPAQ
ncbi:MULTISPECIES: type II secretion system minor pseudopilin GspI [Sphingobium]|uniref:type II secretion system minor pseudopilin GspI n=1 Tax=Sphingobium TaxID=165695 RepID=UPI0015EC6885|nr:MULTISPECIES: type II secretion system minor pseudopilin GspI [Sphingobium]MCW2364435.1 general secretion pathway protein I [Sphingobium sp. B10D3B]MCW2402168.1 general secretion pathway protein I [Sphingobium sp. B10D7B]MCW2409147.1 general secretion pathway protein I [Sphingobium xanthum]